jgi:hypothetical protein
MIEREQMDPRPGENIKQWVVDKRKLRAREVETCPRLDVRPHLDNTGAICRNKGRPLWIDVESHECCYPCNEMGAALAGRPDIAAWRSDRAKWAEPCADRSALSDEIQPAYMEHRQKIP